MKMFSHRLSLLTVAFLVATFAAANAMAGSVDVSPNSGVGNTPITVTVSGFTPGNNNNNTVVDISIDGSYLGSCGCPGPGSCTCSIQTSMSSQPGPHDVVANGSDGSTAHRQFTVLTPSFIIDRSCLTNGTKLIAIGYNWPRNGSVSLLLDGGLWDQANCDSAGGFSLWGFLPSLTSGSHTIRAINGISDLSQSFVVGSNLCPQAGRGVESCDATITHDGNRQKFNPNDPVFPGDTVETGKNCPVFLLFPDHTTMKLGPNATLKIDEYVYDPNNGAGDKGFYSFLRGVFVYTSGLIGHADPDDLHVHVPAGDIGIRGTQFIARRDPCSTTQEVYLISGELAITPLNTGVTNIVDAPVTVLFDASTVTTSALTQATYDALAAEISQTNNPVTFASWQVHYFDCTNNNPSAAADADPDGDGQNNTAEFLTGTNPTDSASAFRILNVARTNNDMRVCWFTHAGLTNIVLAAPDLSGSYSNVSPDLLITGTTNSDDVVTNYVEVGAATNSAARYYRIKLVP